MTAPLTPPHQPPQNDDAWQAPAPPPYGGYEKPDPDPDGDSKRDLLDAGVTVLVMTVLGVVMGLLWLWLAPKVPLVSNGEAVFLKDTEGEEAIGADGTFVLLGVAFGAVTAATAVWLRRRGGVALVIALAVGALLGSLLAWGVGVWFGPTQDVAQHAQQVGEGVTFDAYLKLQAWGSLLAWPLSAMVVHLGLTALFGPRDPEPEWEDGGV
ncbi:ABC transporter permease [Streptomyces sp. NPDC002187]|uniref:ABC transporter permease n=1 Tax=Streptomyces sp. NPDC002187 TaxID=3364637 RepID=UPI003684CE35